MCKDLHIVEIHFCFQHQSKLTYTRFALTMANRTFSTADTDPHCTLESRSLSGNIPGHAQYRATQQPNPVHVSQTPRGCAVTADNLYTSITQLNTPLPCTNNGRRLKIKMSKVSDFGRRELQKLAKQHGVRANAKSSVIFAELQKLGLFNITKRRRRARPKHSQLSQNANPNASIELTRPLKRRARRRGKAVSVSDTRPATSCASPIVPDSKGIGDLLGRILPSFRDIEKHYTLIKQLGDVCTRFPPFVHSVSVLLLSQVVIRANFVAVVY